MKHSINKIILVGTLGRDGDTVREDGNLVIFGSLATSHREGENLVTDWHRLVVRGPLAELAAPHFVKGNRVYIEGHMEYGAYERNGITVPIAEVVVREFVLLGLG